MAVRCRSGVMTLPPGPLRHGRLLPYLVRRTVRHATVLSTKALQAGATCRSQRAGATCRSREPEPGERAPLSRERVLRGAVAVADADGVGALTIRSLARRSGSSRCRVYHYVASKDEILDGIVDLVFSRDRPARAGRRLAVGDAPPGGLGPPGAAAPPLGDRAHGVARQPGPATLRHHDAVLATLRAAGFSVENDRPRLRPARQLRLRLRPAGGISAVQGPGDRRRGR